MALAYMLQKRLLISTRCPLGSALGFEEKRRKKAIRGNLGKMGPSYYYTQGEEEVPVVVNIGP